MCLGFMVGDALLFALAGAFGYAKPFGELPELSLLVVTLSMTAPMVAWMRYRGMPRRETLEMGASMVALAAALLLAGVAGLIARPDMPLLEHGLMMPVMLGPMLLRLDVYTARMPKHGRASATVIQ